ncbi:hypothetical protein QF030_000703 [Streptomyces rishiriensis]|uniref:Uncharacterized protein n=1 Tax=Streptomyces rishiriensis TaxID=68264 RepID=A0ABU0NHE9_STRRH|nr:hypothetical protein [Streptomyces rishiriensis]
MPPNRGADTADPAGQGPNARRTRQADGLLRGPGLPIRAGHLADEGRRRTALLRRHAGAAAPGIRFGAARAATGSPTRSADRRNQRLPPCPPLAWADPAGRTVKTRRAEGRAVPQRRALKGGARPQTQCPACLRARLRSRGTGLLSVGTPDRWCRLPTPPPAWRVAGRSSFSPCVATFRGIDIRGIPVAPQHRPLHRLDARLGIQHSDTRRKTPLASHAVSSARQERTTDNAPKWRAFACSSSVQRHGDRCWQLT